MGDSRVSSAGVRDATMVDIGVKSRPPGAPPDDPGVWVQKVKGTSVGGVPIPEEVISEEFVAERLRVEFPNGEDGEPVITIGQEMVDAMNGLWKRCMIVKVLGRHISLPVLNRKLRELWKPCGAMYVMDLPRQFFMIRFEIEEEYLAALTGGPWKAFGSYLIAQAWSPDFDPLRDEIVTTPVWVRISNFPWNLYHKYILLGIANSLGKPIKVDLNTLSFERGRFARICVEVNLQKPLKGTVVVNGERFYVPYEGLANICSQCGMYGHLVHKCPRGVSHGIGEESMSVEVTKNVQNPVVPTHDADGFTPVRQRKTVAQVNRNVNAQGGARVNVNRNPMDHVRKKGNELVVTSNSFGKLREDVETEGRSKEIIGVTDNKENEYPMNSVVQDRSGEQVKVTKFVATTEGKGKGVVREGLRDRQAWSYKAHESNGVKPKYTNHSKPTRGVVFGSTRRDFELSANGKRVRIEEISLDRPGGSFFNGVDGERRVWRIM
ncbi:putative transcription factor interactor and regulator CCHC(Zn) family [Arabidopsis thaliana]